MRNKLSLVEELQLTKSDLLAMLENIYMSRKLDDAEIMMRKQNKAFFQISGAGHEGVLTAFAKILRPSYDYFIPYYRDRALCLALGVTPYEMLCQANGNIGDTASHGRQMPAHWGNKKLNIITKSSCTGTQFLQACGIAEAGRYLEELKQDKLLDHSLPSHSDEIVYTSSGDGTTSQGELWEALTTATVNKLPVLFMIEDNGYAISVPTFVQTPGGSISQALANFPGLKIFTCNGNCPIESYKTALEVEEYMRAGNGPALVHAKVTRPYSHSLSDDQRMYRTVEELEQEKKEDVFYSYPQFLVESKLCNEQEISELLDRVSLTVKQAMQQALETPWPEKSSALDHLYSSDVDMRSKEFMTSPQFSGKHDIPMASMINRTLKSEFRKNLLLRAFGEDVADFSELKKLHDKQLKGKGGVFKVTSGLQRESHCGQVFNSPLAEANIIGRAIGQAMRGIKPIVEIQFFDYIWTAFMQLKNEMATTRYRSGGEYKSPLVVRVPIGGYLRGGAIYHSQCGESIFTHIPGIYVAFPSNALDAAGLLRTAIRGDDPVMFLEHKHLYYQGYNRTADPGDDFMIPFGKGSIVHSGQELTIVAWGAMVQKAVDVAKKLKDRYSIEVIDPRTLVPFDLELVQQSLRKTNRLLIAHEETKTSGFAGEIMALINETCFEYLDAPMKRVTAKDVHCAYCPDLEEEILPQVKDVECAVIELMSY